MLSNMLKAILSRPKLTILMLPNQAFSHASMINPRELLRSTPTTMFKLDPLNNSRLLLLLNQSQLPFKPTNPSSINTPEVLSPQLLVELLLITLSSLLDGEQTPPLETTGSSRTPGPQDGERQVTSESELLKVLVSAVSNLNQLGQSLNDYIVKEYNFSLSNNESNNNILFLSP